MLPPSPLWRGAGLWLGVAHLGVALIFALNRPDLLGKRRSGRMSLLLALPVLPYLVLVWAFHRIKSLRGDWALAPWSSVAEGLWVGRIGPHEPPPSARWVIDLTSEFPAPPAWCAHPGYRCLPTLNRSIPDPATARQLLEEIGGMPVAVACGAGKGRSALLVAALMVRRGLAANIPDAESTLADLRPGVHLHPAQRCLAESLARPATADPAACPAPLPSRTSPIDRKHP